MAGGRMGGQGNLIQRGIWIFVSCCIVVAVWNTFPHDPKGFYGELSSKSEQLRDVGERVGNWLSGFADGAAGGAVEGGRQQGRPGQQSSPQGR